MQIGAAAGFGAGLDQVLRNPDLFSFPECALPFFRGCQPTRERKREGDRGAAGSKGERPGRESQEEGGGVAGDGTCLFALRVSE